MNQKSHASWIWVSKRILMDLKHLKIFTMSAVNCEYARHQLVMLGLLLRAKIFLIQEVRLKRAPASKYRQVWEETICQLVILFLLNLLRTMVGLLRYSCQSWQHNSKFFWEALTEKACQCFKKKWGASPVSLSLSGHPWHSSCQTALTWDLDIHLTERGMSKQEMMMLCRKKAFSFPLEHLQTYCMTPPPI